MIGKLFKRLAWWGIIAAIAFFFLQANLIDSPEALWNWAKDAAIGVKDFFVDTSGQVDLTDVDLNGEEIDVPNEYK
jgi:hypothetical protein